MISIDFVAESEQNTPFHVLETVEFIANKCAKRVFRKNRDKLTMLCRKSSVHHFYGFLQLHFPLGKPVIRELLISIWLLQGPAWRLFSLNLLLLVFGHFPMH